MQKSRTGSFRFGGSNRSSFNTGGFGASRPFSAYGTNMRRRPMKSSFRERGESIDISKFVKKASFSAPKQTFIIKHAFADFHLCDELKTNLAKREYTTPTPIQDQAIEPILAGKDLIGLANTGTGKTAAFLLPLINKIAANRSERVLIIAPTRELAQQIDLEFRQFAFGMRIYSTVCVGGLPIHRQISDLRRRPHFVIGTPGRLKDLSERGMVKYDSFKSIVLDEVDRMLDMGFIDDIKKILSELPPVRQSLFFSATMPPKIRDLAAQVLTNPITIEVKSGDTAENVDQDIVRVRDRGAKLDQLHELLQKPEFDKVLIFSETKRDVEKLTDDLINKGHKAESIHGDKKQRDRQKALARFKDSSINILVATDVAARGLDIKDISHVINYTLPQTYTDYVHRIGRTGRGDAKGCALTFVETR